MGGFYDSIKDFCGRCYDKLGFTGEMAYRAIDRFAYAFYYVLLVAPSYALKMFIGMSVSATGVFVMSVEYTLSIVARKELNFGGSWLWNLGQGIVQFRFSEVF